MTGSEVVAQSNVKSQPSEVNDNYVSKPVGIQNFREDPKVEVQSPFRKKRGTLVKLKVQEDDEEDLMIEKLEADQTKIQPFFEQVKTTFVKIQDEYKSLHEQNVQDISKNHTAASLKYLFIKWQHDLEMQIPEELDIDANSITDFNNKNSAFFKEIEMFVL